MQRNYSVFYSLCFYLGVFCAAFFTLLFTVGSSCQGDYTRIQSEALAKAEVYQPRKEPDSIIADVPHCYRFLGFESFSGLSTLGESEQDLPAQVVPPPLIGLITIDHDFDNQPEVLRFIYALKDNEAFIDEDNDGAYDPDEEVHIEYSAFDTTFLVSNPDGGEMADPGSYQMVVFRKLFQYQGIQPFQPVTVPVRFFFDDSATGKTTEEVVNKLILRAAQIIPHVAVGHGPEITITTQVVINNANQKEANVSIRFFSSATGDPLEVTIEGVRASVHELVLPAGRSRVLELEPGPSGLETGWAFVHGDPAVDAAANFVTFSEPTEVGRIPALLEKPVEAEAGIAATGAQTSHVVSLLKGSNASNTALAIVNPTPYPATIHLTLIRQQDSTSSLEGAPGLRLKPWTSDQVVAEKELHLDPRRQTAQFFDGLFGVEVERFVGTAYLESNTDIAVMALKTVKGKQSASLPSGYFSIGRGR